MDDGSVARFRRRHAGERRAQRSSRSSRTGSKCLRRSRCARPWAGRKFARLGFGATTARRRRCRSASKATGSTASARCSASRGRFAARQLVVAPAVAPPSDPERTDRAGTRSAQRHLALAWRRADMDALSLARVPLSAVSDERRDGLVWIGFNQGTGAVFDGDSLGRLRAHAGQHRLARARARHLPRRRSGL